jgi:Na+-driven multidrug efflux pump
MPAMAIGAAVSAMAAQNIGAGRWDRVSAITRAGLLYNFGLTGGIVAVLTLFDRPLLALFLGHASPALPIAEHISLIATWSFILFGMTMVFFATVRANGAVLGPLVILFVGMYPVRLGFALALEPWLGADAIWWSFPLGSFANVGMAALYYRSSYWRRGALGAGDAVQGCDQRSHADVEPGATMKPAG